MKKITIFGDTASWNLATFQPSCIAPLPQKKIHESDAVIYNLEGPIAFGDLPHFTYRDFRLLDIPLQILTKITKKQQPIVFSDTSILDLIKLNSNTIFTLANNHVKDVGKSYLFRTVEEIEKKNARVIGFGRNRFSQAYLCEIIPDVILINVNTVGSYKNNIPFHLYDTTISSYGASHLSFSRLSELVRSFHLEKKLVILVMHAGLQLKPLEKQNVPFDTIRSIQADVTVLHHPHIYLESPYEKDRIFFVGDFVFNNPNYMNLDRPSSFLEITLDGNEIQTELHKGRVCDYYEYPK